MPRVALPSSKSGVSTPHEHKKRDLILMLERRHADDDRAALAALRRGLTQGMEASVYPYVAPYFPSERRPWIERTYVLVAALFATHPSDHGLTVGRALRQVQEKSDSKSVEPRFVALLNAHPDDLGQHLRHAISLARSKDVNIDWDDLLSAVLGWDHEDRWAQRRWAHDFWTYSDKEESTP